VPTRECWQSDLLNFSLVPDPEDDHQIKEWEKFMRYLCSSGKVNTVFPVRMFSYLLIIYYGDTTYATYSIIKSPL
jgi:ABC-type phosphate/phosphonate transport system substrate-binding protein